MGWTKYPLLGLAGVVAGLVLWFGLGSDQDPRPRELPRKVSEPQAYQEPGREPRDGLAGRASSEGLSAEVSEVERAVRTVYAAYNERNLDAFLAGWTDNGFARVFQFPKTGAINRLFAGSTPVAVGKFSNTAVTRRNASTEVELAYGQVEEIHALALVKEGNNWLIDDDKKRDPTVYELSRRGRAEIMDVALGLSGIQFDPGRAATGTMAFRVANTDTRPHEFVVMKWLPDSESEQAIGTTGPLQPGASTTLILTDLTPGRYVILCNMLDSDGMPYSAKGMRTEFTIQ